MAPGSFYSYFNVNSALISGRQTIISLIEFAISTACLIIPLCQARIGRLIDLVLPLRISNPGHQSSSHARRAKVAGFIEGAAFSSPEFQQGLFVNAEALGYLRAG
jgi:hypothetical protein